MSLFKKTVLLASTIAAFNAAAEKLEVGSDDLSQIEVVSSLKNFKPSNKDFRIYFIGNSITRHGFNKTTIAKLKWKHIAGMAASSEDKDYAHLLGGKVSKMFPDKKIRLIFGRAKDAKFYKPHLLILQWGEHEKLSYGEKKVKEKYRNILDAIMQLEPKPLIICTGVWSPRKNKKYLGWPAKIENIIKSECKSRNIPFASVEKYALNPQCSGTGGSGGVRWHPNDAGQAGYAVEIFKLFKKHYSKTSDINISNASAPAQEQAVGKIIIDSNFDDGKSKMAINPVRWKIADGSLSSYGNKMAQISIKKLNLKNFAISYKVRLLNLPAKKDGHCGFIMSNGKGKYVRIYFRNSGSSLWVLENKKTIFHKRIFTQKKFWKISPQAKWNKISFTVKNGHAELNINGRLAHNFKFPVNSVHNITIYSYIIDCGIDDFKLIKLTSASNAKTKTADSSKPAFYASYDGSISADADGKKIQPLMQSGTSFVPGISGQAVFIGEKTKAVKTAKGGKAKLKIKYGSMSFRDGELISKKSIKGMGNCTISGLNVPEFTLKFAAKRLEVPPGEQHFGLIIRQADGQTISFYLDGKRLSILRMKGKKKLEHRHILQNFILKKGPDSPWYDFSFQFLPDKIILTPQGRKALTLAIKNAPTTLVNFYAYKLNAAFKNISMTGPDGKNILTNADFVTSSSKHRSKGKALLQYPADKLFGDSGTVMFWFQPDWDGKINPLLSFPWYYLFTGQNTNGKNSLIFFMWRWLRCDLPRKNLASVTLQRRNRGSWLRGDWIHLAFTWNANGWNKLYVNGLPYAHAARKQQFPLYASVNMKNIKKFCVGSTTEAGGLRKNANGAIDELKIYKGALPDQDVMAEYHRFMPLELVMDRIFIPAGKPETLSLTVAPAGTFTNLPLKPAKVKMQLRLVGRDSNKTVWSGDYDLDIQKRRDLNLAVGTLDKGIYTLQCVVKNSNGSAQKSFKVLVYQEQPAPKVTNAPVKLGAPFINIDCAASAAKALYDQKPSIQTTANGTKYLQAAAKHGARFAFKVEFPDEYLNKRPVMLEITWPDTAARSMGLYMFPENRKIKQNRDRLEGGIQSGDEYPLTGKMVTTKYIFYPSVKTYLFEARTFVNSMPAAVSSFKVRPMLEVLPELKINRPEKLPSRSLGHMDEDQTYHVLFFWDAKRFGDFYKLSIVRKTCDYFAYTGQNVIAYPILRYFYTLYNRPGYGGSGLFSAFLDIMHKRNMKFIGTINQDSLPEIYTRPDKFDEMKKQGLYVVDFNGRVRGATLANPAHPFIRKVFLNEIKELLLRFGKHPAFAGLDLWARQTWSFRSLKNGYGDFTVKLFASETGIKVPDFKGEGRFHKRYDYLTGKVRKQWLKWRAKKSTDMLGLISAEMNKINPKLVLYVNSVNMFKNPEMEAAEGIESLNLGKFFYESNSLDLKAINAFPNVRTAALRDVTAYRWCRHWDNRETIYDEILYTRGLWKAFLKNGSAPAWSYNRYFETFQTSLEPKNYKSYFQNADIKAWGRFFLKEWAFCLAEMDSPMMLIGAQPLGTSGRDEVTREFARAYRALPAVPFIKMAGLSDPVTVRYLNESGQTWLYAINTCWSSVELTLDNIVSSPIELSSGQNITVSGSKLKISLKPYQLRSFRMKGNVIPRKVSVSIPAKTIAFLQKKIDEIGAKLLLIKKSGLDTKVYEKIIKQGRNKLKKQHISAVMGILYSKRLRGLDTLGRAAASGYLKQQEAMLKRGHIRVNCGSGRMQYFKASNGKLFLPDRPYAPGSYGYVGNYRKVLRDVSKITGTADADLFATEAYDLDEYRFTVKPGTYTVKLYLKHGWKRSAKPGKFVFNVDIEGKRYLDKMDVFLESGSDFDRAFIKTIDNVKVKDGILNIKFSVPEGINSSVKLCNAIEVIVK